ncbi:MAG TPA: alanine--glyoxylate aminotransferase family protein [Candidatus Fraserbacteria bacterium]|nr:alanine--glyoxylate aminotransferase family protein [Candidatus Fraserbacteria bacterium]
MDWPIVNFAAGPVAVSERTLRDLARPMLYHYDPAFIEFFEQTLALLKQVYRTQYDVVIMQGEAILGLEATAASLISPGDKVLNLVSGVFGKWYELFIEKYGGVAVELAVPYNEAIDPEDVRSALQQDPSIKLLSVVHSETPSGTINPVKDIGNIAKEFGVITVMDTVSGLGGAVFSPEEWAIDVAVAGPQKCLGGTPGLALMAVSPEAWKAMETRKNPLRGSYLSILDWKDAWIENHRFPYTPSVGEIYALESVLSQVLEEGLENYVARHQQISHACREGVKALGLKLWAAREEINGTAVTAVTVPEGITDEQLRGHLRACYGVMISGGYGELAGRLFRLGHMGKVAHPTYLAAQLGVLERSLADLGWPVEFGAGVGAAMADLKDWQEFVNSRS